MPNPRPNEEIIVEVWDDTVRMRSAAYAFISGGDLETASDLFWLIHLREHMAEKRMSRITKAVYYMGHVLGLAATVGLIVFAFFM